MGRGMGMGMGMEMMGMGMKMEIEMVWTLKTLPALHKFERGLPQSNSGTRSSTGR